MGFREGVARSTLAEANETHDWRIYADFAQVLIGIARPLYAHDPISVDLDQSLYALNFDRGLVLSKLCPREQREAEIDCGEDAHLAGSAWQNSTFVRINDGTMHDVNILDEILPEAGAFNVLLQWSLFARGGQEHWRELRSHGDSDGYRIGQGVSGFNAARQLR